MKNMKNNLPFIIIMSIFFVSCAVMTVFTVSREPQYVQIVHKESGVSESGHMNIDGTGVNGVNGDIGVPLEPININTATSEELQMLPGIGESRARDIIAYRDRHGEFLYIEEIMEVSGIGEGMFTNIKEFIFVE